MSSPAESYFATASDMLARARDINAATLKVGGQLIGESIAAGGVLHTFGSGHSEIIGREIIGR
ncbi:SIS domain-containing protein, partial [Opitutaceae bacterium]|nr:SIS domain-containing protein [Opitutaceae bacterium]